MIDLQILDWLSENATETTFDEDGIAHVWTGHGIDSKHFQGATLREAVSNAIAGKEHSKPDLGYDDITGTHK